MLGLLLPAPHLHLCQPCVQVRHDGCKLVSQSALTPVPRFADPEQRPGKEGGGGGVRGFRVLSSVQGKRACVCGVV